MKKNLKRTILLLIIFAFSMQITARSQECTQQRFKIHSKKGLTGYYFKLQEALKLTDPQISALQDKYFAFQKETVKIKAVLGIALIELREIKAKDDVNISKAEEKIRQISAIEADMKIKRLKYVNDCKSILNLDQKNTLKNIRRKPFFLKSLTAGTEIEETAVELSPEEQEEISFIEDVFGPELFY